MALNEERVLVVGLGEVGRALFDVLKESGCFTVYGFDIDEKKMQETGQSTVPSKVDIMHICIPCPNQDNFLDAAADYVERFKPELAVINSTIPPETTMKLHKRCGGLTAHSPTRGVHESPEYMKWEMRRWTKYVGGVDAESAEAARKHFEEAGLRTKVLRSSLETELAKLFETTYRAWMIACFQEMHRISRHFGADFDEVVDFLGDTHLVRHDRPVMFPDVIGGHCLVQNTELLLKSYDSEFLRLILKSNEKRKEEVKDEKVRAEIEKVKIKAKAAEKRLPKV